MRAGVDGFAEVMRARDTKPVCINRPKPAIDPSAGIVVLLKERESGTGLLACGRILIAGPLPFLYAFNEQVKRHGYDRNDQCRNS